MSWDLDCRRIEIKLGKEDFRKAYKIINKINKKIKYKFIIEKTPTSIIIDEVALSKHFFVDDVVCVSYSRLSNYDFNKFINELIMIDKTNISIYGYNDLGEHVVYYYDEKLNKITSDGIEFATGCFLEDEEDYSNDDKKIVLAEVKKNGFAIKHTSNRLRNDKEIVLAGVEENGWAFEYASKELQNDKDVVLAAVKKCGYVLEDISKELQSDKDIVLAAVKNCGYALEDASKELQSNKEVVLAAVEQDGLALDCASKELKNDKDIVLAAVEQEGLALEYASDNLKDDKDVVLKAIKKDPRAFYYASLRLKQDSDLYKIAQGFNPFEDPFPPLPDDTLDSFEKPINSFETDNKGIELKDDDLPF